MDEEHTTFVVPALEFSSLQASEDVEGPLDKEALHALWRRGLVQTMHPCCFGYAGPFKIAEWFSTPSGFVACVRLAACVHASVWVWGAGCGCRVWVWVVWVEVWNAMEMCQRRCPMLAPPLHRSVGCTRARAFPPIPTPPPPPTHTPSPPPPCPPRYPIQYEQSFEPYFIQKAPVFPFDERFVGRHHNKHSLFFEMYVRVGWGGVVGGREVSGDLIGDPRHPAQGWASTHCSARLCCPPTTHHPSRFAAGFKLHVLARSWIMDVPHAISQHGSGGGVEPGNKLKWATFLKETTVKYGLQCPARGSCWWREEDVDHRSPLWAVYDWFLHAVSC
jgi:hypothetical protein